MKRAFIFVAYCLIAYACTDAIVSNEILQNSYPSTKSEEPLTANYLIDDPYTFDKIYDSIRQFCSLEEKFAECELPTEMISNMSTSSLLLTCVNHPLARLFFAYDNHLSAMDVFYNYCNVFREFIGREDATDEIIKLYGSLIISPQAKGISVSHDGYEISGINECFLELVMGSGYLEDITTEKYAVSLLPLVEARLSEKIIDVKTYSYFSLESTLLLWELLQDKSYEPVSRSKSESIYHSLYDKYVSTPQTKTPVLLGYTTVYTLFGQSVQGRYYSELTNIEASALRSEALNYVSEEDIICEPTSAFNCHGYAWNIYNGGETCQIWPYTNNGGTNLAKYWTQDYYGTVGQSDAEIAVYGSMDHSAVKYSSSKWESKWGNGPLVIHSLTNVPYPTSSITYYAQVVHTVNMNVPPTGLVGTSVICAPGWLANVSNTNCVWYITNQHGNQSGYTQSISGSTNTITFTQTGSYDISCEVYWNSIKVGQANDQIIITN